ncbi:hypothetical protein AX774_g1927 [Zancudomyces culisetae]|uniref:Uncharacterized protein n=1 Tax=Zancudomyces culisetae TaxID=1213189 RepID=A0A1R1PI78_ZANCU|nr:hypothetical protein AX774_g5854 [Zancudomyces culisetae]OMH84543.1 hypothetical protein AX774_g1927 [Zancudomyces culisetae]|eukprot:OMH80705.1 hypothetical protein AX774_g5854 [Zancudomyces culisetae]
MVTIKKTFLIGLLTLICEKAHAQQDEQLGHQTEHVVDPTLQVSTYVHPDTVGEGALEAESSLPHNFDDDLEDYNYGHIHDVFLREFYANKTEADFGELEAVVHLDKRDETQTPITNKDRFYAINGLYRTLAKINKIKSDIYVLEHAGNNPDKQINEKLHQLRLEIVPLMENLAKDKKIVFAPKEQNDKYKALDSRIVKLTSLGQFIADMENIKRFIEVEKASICGCELTSRDREVLKIIDHNIGLTSSMIGFTESYIREVIEEPRDHTED